MATAATMRFLDVWYARIDADKLLAELTAAADKATVKAAQKNLAKARKRTSLGSLSKFAQRVDGGYRIKQQPPADRAPARGRCTATSSRSSARDSATTRARWPPIGASCSTTTTTQDFARKVVGVGSVGTEAFMILLMGDREDDPLFLQIKEASTSVLAPYAGASEYEHQGERVVQGQRLMQAASDAFLGWVTGTGKRHREFYVRQLRDMKGSAAIETMPPARLARYGELCGATLARAHARTGDAAKITGYLGDDDTFDRALERFAVAYADQNDADYAAFTRAADEQRIAVQDRRVTDHPRLHDDDCHLRGRTSRWPNRRCSVVAVQAMEHIARAFEWIGISVIVAGSLVTVWISFAAYRTSGSAAAYEAGRRSFGRALLASLEVFVAADLIRTVSVDLTLEGVGALGLLVVIRTILSFSIDIEISGALPWRSGATETAASEGRTGGR